MSTGTGIEWTDATWNPVAGCTPVSPGCLNCYAATMSHRLDKMGQAKYRGLTVLHNGRRTFNGKISFDEAALAAPLGWRKPRRVFVNSMSDLFHEDVPFDFVDRVFAVMALTPQHTYQVLTKRPERMAEYLNQSPFDGRSGRCEIFFQNAMKIRPPLSTADAHEALGKCIGWPLPNVWLGTSVEHELAAHRIYTMRRVPAVVRFLSLEPLLGPLNPIKLDGIHWVIVGGESGPGARQCHIEWIMDIIGQCKAASVACFVKQLGAEPTFFDDGDGAGGTIYEPRVGPPDYPPIEDRKGGDWDEWTGPLSQLRVREFPTATRDTVCKS